MELAQAMKQRGWTDQQLADAIASKGYAVHRTTITKIRNGTRRPSPDLALEISRALDGLTSPYELLYNSAA